MISTMKIAAMRTGTTNCVSARVTCSQLTWPFMFEPFHDRNYLVPVYFAQKLSQRQSLARMRSAGKLWTAGFVQNVPKPCR